MDAFDAVVDYLEQADVLRIHFLEHLRMRSAWSLVIAGMVLPGSWPPGVQACSMISSHWRRRVSRC